MQWELENDERKAESGLSNDQKQEKGRQIMTSSQEIRSELHDESYGNKEDEM